MAKRMTLQQRERYEAQVDAFRRLVNGLPRWETRDGPDGQAEIVDTDFGEPVFLPCGVWEPNLVRFFTHVRYDPLIKLLGLLEAARGTDAGANAAEFLESLRLIDSSDDRAHRP